MRLLNMFLREEEGQDGVEYALLIGFVSCIIVVGATAFTGAFSTFWTDAGGAVTKAGGKASGL
jgi:Flp pilus assembly pilin Flp